MHSLLPDAYYCTECALSNITSDSVMTWGPYLYATVSIECNYVHVLTLIPKISDIILAMIVGVFHNHSSLTKYRLVPQALAGLLYF